jgi:hypothetical protein
MAEIDMKTEWAAGRGRAAAGKVKEALDAGRGVRARLVGPHHCLPDGTICPVKFAGPTALYMPLHFDGSPVDPAAVPGYEIIGTGWQVGWSGGGFWNPHIIIIDDSGNEA